MPIASWPTAAPGNAERLDAQAVTSLAALEALRGEWQALWARSGARPFQSPAWLLPWWRHVGRGEPACLAVRDAAMSRLRVTR